MGVQEHKKEAPKAVRCKVITVSDTRNEETDKSGQLMIDILKTHGHEIVAYEIVKDEQALIRNAVLNGCEDSHTDVILTNGGTGIANRDVTIETIKQLITKEIVGFGELFRMLSYRDDIGSAAMLSRAIAGIALNTVIFSTPGSSGAVKLAMEKLIIPEIGHVVREVHKDKVF